MSFKKADNDNNSTAPLASTDRAGEANMSEHSHESKRKCPMCGKNTVHAFRPFCSKKCADLDLGQWLNGGYTIAGHADAEEDGALPTQELELQKNIQENE